MRKSFWGKEGKFGLFFGIKPLCIHEMGKMEGCFRGEFFELQKKRKFFGMEKKRINS